MYTYHFISRIAVRIRFTTTLLPVSRVLMLRQLRHWQCVHKYTPHMWDYIVVRRRIYCVDHDWQTGCSLSGADTKSVDISWRRSNRACAKVRTSRLGRHGVILNSMLRSSLRITASGTAAHSQGVLGPAYDRATFPCPICEKYK